MQFSLVAHMQEEKIVWNIERESTVELRNNGLIYFMSAEPSKDQNKKGWVVGLSVRVRPEVERVLREYADKTGWLPHSVRNVAILVGLLALARGWVEFPENLDQYRELLKEVAREIRGENHAGE
jgi:hypothetical protein